MQLFPLHRYPIETKPHTLVVSVVIPPAGLGRQLSHQPEHSDNICTSHHKGLLAVAEEVTVDGVLHP